VKQLADGVWQLRGFPPNAINVYVLDDVLNDRLMTGPSSKVERALREESARRLVELEPALACFGHGPPLRDARKFVQVIQGLPA
jgi:hypothetical protein